MAQDYDRVEQALEAGADPAMLCETCPWDRTCISRPESTKADFDKQMAEAKVQDQEALAKAQAEGKADKALPMATLITVMAAGGRHRTAPCCPVFLVRLQSGQGHAIAAMNKHQMRTWLDV